MPFAFCTREKQPWMQFAEDVMTGPSTTFLKPYAKKYNMVRPIHYVLSSSSTSPFA